RRLSRIHLKSPFVLRSVDPPLESVFGTTVLSVSRMGKRLVVGFPDDLFVVIHLMIAGRLKWSPTSSPQSRTPSQKIVLAVFEFDHGMLFFPEASSKKRARLQLVRGATAVRALDPGGIEPLSATPDAFREALIRESHTVKRTLTDPRLFSGIG